ncbi:AzlD domain-containing protein [Anianabacter salinae]|uniref:AzlD domain-containing protein n=1 Tax=Anianabacter salinae TaxID=2851023 RepID=UPI00225DE4DE|nr:AzlD domain-containing protein [Anianabacter salinae]MBV0913254.1 AzlD domain-containing protein [Anianabacter salinae]
MIDTGDLWIVILGLGLGTYLIRFSFLGIIGDRELPPLVLRLLRYTPVAVIPGLIAPMLIWPETTGGTVDTPRLAAAAVTVIVGFATRNFVAAMVAGAATLFALLALIG